MQKDWTNIVYLQSGTPTQQSAYRAIKKLGIMQTLKSFSPVLVGTIPLDIQIPGSDLDIICSTPNLTDFQVQVRTFYMHLPHFKDKIVSIRGVDSYVANFEYNQWPFELFAQVTPVESQYGYRHMLIESKLLEEICESGKEEIRRLKWSGMKTEPAFAHYFKLDGNDPYEALLELEIDSK